MICLGQYDTAKTLTGDRFCVKTTLSETFSFIFHVNELLTKDHLDERQLLC